MVGTAILIGACAPNEDYADLGCRGQVTTCRVIDSGFAGYQRACMTSCPGFEPARIDDDESADADAPDAGGAASGIATTSESQSLMPAATTSPDVGAAHAPGMTRYTAFEMPCERDSQCGPGKCLSGSCYYGCQSDTQCGSGDRCSVESGVRVCMPDPNPPIECTRSAQCESREGCLNGGCRQTCTSTVQCDNLLDRCASGFCVPDRRPLGECVVNSECGDGLVCLDGSCVPACPAEEGAGGVCLAEPPVAPVEPEGEAPSVPPTSTPSTPPADDGNTTAPDDGGEAPVSSETPSEGDGEAPTPDEGDATPPDDGTADDGTDDDGTDDDSEPPGNEAGDPISEIE
jgi:hypothetical protein